MKSIDTIHDAGVMGVTSKLLSDLIDKNEIALVRYRM